MHYQRMSRIALREAARRLDGHPRVQGYMRLLDLSEKTAPDVAGSGTVGQPGHVAWTEEQAMALIQTLLAAEQAHHPGHAQDVQEGAQQLQDAPTLAQEPAQPIGRLVEQEDDGDAG